MKTINDTRLEVIGFGAVPASVDEQRAMARELISLRTVLADLPAGAISGGWTAKGISAYAKQLEDELTELKTQQPIAWTDAEELRDLDKYRNGYFFKINPENPYTDPRRQIMLYRAPVISTQHYVCEIIKEAWRLIPQSESTESAEWHTAASQFLRDNAVAQQSEPKDGDV